MKTRIAFHTLGCKLNFSETSGIARDFRDGEYEIVDFHEMADIYVLNTCSVTGAAEKKCRQAIRQARTRNPDASIAVVGCFAQLKPGEVAAFEGVDIVLGSNAKFGLYDIVEKRKAESRERKIILTDGNIRAGRREDFTPTYSAGDRTRSFVKVQDGCDYFCSYCTIPLARGLSRSGSIAQVLDTVSQALRSGVKEIILTGVNVGDFGKDSEEDFFDLVKALDAVNRIPRIRISSIEPNLLTDEMIEFISRSRRFMPHFHIPLQSGSDKVLGLMKRKYKREVFASRVLRIKELMPHACVAADVIVGFPGETDEDFRETVDFIASLPISYCHVFTYSERPGTLAAKLEDKVKDFDKTERSKLLHKLSEEKKKAFYQSCRGLQTQVLFESDHHDGYMFGFTENYIRVKTPFREELVNEIAGLELREYREVEEVYLVEVD